MAEKELKIKKLSNLPLPEYALKSDVGFDLRADEGVVIEPYEQKTVKTGIMIEIPKNHVGLIRDRAGIVTKMGIHTGAGTIDPDYRGEISVVLINFGDETARIERGMRIAQMIVLPVVKVNIKEVGKLGNTERQERGFGSTGIKEIVKELNKIRCKSQK